MVGAPVVVASVVGVTEVVVTGARVVVVVGGVVLDVVVDQDPRRSETPAGDFAMAGGLVERDSAAEKPSQGEVLSVGPGKALDNGEVRALDVKVGDKVIFGQYGGSTVKIDGEELLILTESEIFGVLEG